MWVSGPQAEGQPSVRLPRSSTNSSSAEVSPLCQGGQHLWVRAGGGQAAGMWALKPLHCPSCACRERWCHMTQEERDDSLRFNENITFGQLG